MSFYPRIISSTRKILLPTVCVSVPVLVSTINNCSEINYFLHLFLLLIRFEEYDSMYKEKNGAFHIDYGEIISSRITLL